MTESEIPSRKSANERWAEIRRRGPLSYILRRGILISGAIFATLRFLDDYFGFFPGSHWRGIRYEIFSFIFAALFFGTLTGWSAWRYRERRFAESA